MKTAISMRIDPDLLAAAKSAAASEHRSLANLVEVALADRIGYSLDDRRVVVMVPEGAASLRGGKIVPRPWETPEEIAQAQAVYDRLIELAEAAELEAGESTAKR